ncbi:MAG TPA: tetratricopeptide repeat protein, partial [Armatimonadetes bacterium]|nr:tetratricopeptide repeat protein [Armatimonadota bacterium]
FIVAWLGEHPYVADARHRKEVNLTAGVHLLEYFHEERQGEQLAYLAWLRPGARNYETIPASAFVRFRMAQLVSYEVRGKTITADFIVDQLTPIQIGKFRLWHVRLRAQPSRTDLLQRNDTATAQGVQYNWTFSDDTRRRGIVVEHLWFVQNEQWVQLTIQAPDGRIIDTLRMSLYLSPDAPAHPDSELLAQHYLSAVWERPLDELGRTALLGVARLATRFRWMPLAFWAYRQFVNRFAQQRARLLQRLAKLACDEQVQRYDVAINVYKELMHNAQDEAEKRVWMLKLAQTFFDARNDDEALKLYQQVVTDEKGFAPVDRRSAYIRIGDIHLRRGDIEQARMAYERAMALTTPRPTRAQILLWEAAHEQAIRTFLEQRAVDSALAEVEKWEERVPVAKLGGVSEYWRGRCLVAKRRFEDAMVALERSVRLAPNSRVAPMALLLLGDVRRQLGLYELAMGAYRKLVKQFPHHPAAEQAQQRIVNLKAQNAK